MSKFLPLIHYTNGWLASELDAEKALISPGEPSMHWKRKERSNFKEDLHLRERTYIWVNKQLYGLQAQQMCWEKPHVITGLTQSPLPQIKCAFYGTYCKTLTLASAKKREKKKDRVKRKGRRCIMGERGDRIVLNTHGGLRPASARPPSTPICHSLRAYDAAIWKTEIIKGRWWWCGGLGGHGGGRLAAERWGQKAASNRGKWSDLKKKKEKCSPQRGLIRNITCRLSPRCGINLFLSSEGGGAQTWQ